MTIFLPFFTIYKHDNDKNTAAGSAFLLQQKKVRHAKTLGGTGEMIQLRKKTLFVLLPILLLALAGCKSGGNGDGQVGGEKPLTISSFKLNTIVTIKIYDSTDTALLTGALAICDQYEELLSRTLPESEIYQLNHADSYPFPVSEPTAQLIRTGLEYSRLSEGAFDITVAPLTSLWNFTSSEHVVPSGAEISKAVSFVGYDDAELTRNEAGESFVSFHKPGMGIDLGAIAKGYIADRIKEYLSENGVKSALIDLGGNMLALGKRPDGNPFVIGIQKPFQERQELALTVETDDWSVVSSGVYERCFTDPETGIFYHHILNPKTGYPYDNSLLQVSILSRSSTDGDALSTACFSLGLEKGMELVNSLEDIYAVFITDDYELHYSDGLKEHFVIEEIS